MFSPGQMWTDLDENEGDVNIADKVVTTYYVPLMAILSVALFLREGSRMGWTDFNYGSAIQMVTKFCVIFFLLPICAGYVFRELSSVWNLVPKPHLGERLQIFVHYCYSYLMLVAMLQQMLPGIKFVGMLAIYVVVIALNGVERYLKVDDSLILSFTIVTSIIMGYSSLLLNMFR